MNRNALLATLCLALCSGLGSAASASASPLMPTDAFSLDSYFRWNRPYTPPVSSSIVIPSRADYVATVSGTFSYYAARAYGHFIHKEQVLCGTPESAPKYSGSAGGTGPVGFDAEFVFARPWVSAKCRRAHLPVRWSNFEMTTDTHWRHPTILGGLPSAPSAGHTYSFAVVGDNRPVKFRLADVYPRDNYGILKIQLAPATTAVCQANYRAFGLTSPTQCALGT